MNAAAYKTWLDVVSSALTALALIIGGGFGAYQYLGKVHDDRVKETLNFLDRYNSEPAVSARAEQDRKWELHEEEEARTAGKDYDAFLTRVIKQEGLGNSAGVLNDFFAALQICVQNKICDPDVALQLFQKDACTLLNRHFAFFQERRLSSGDKSIARGTELFATDRRGAANLSCVRMANK